VREGWNGGAESGHKVRLLEYGLKFTKLTSNPDESQLVEARTFNGEEICRIFDVHPSMVGYKSDSKYNSVEAQNVAFLQHTLMPHIKRFEQQLNKRLLRSNEVSTHAFKWNVKGLLRGDIKTQGEYYDKLIAKGVLSINEVRSLENMNPVEGGDARLVQVNQIPLEHMDEYGKKISAEGTVNTNAQ
jgi:HK97 family phage portal protein